MKKTITLTVATPIIKTRDLACECTNTRCTTHRPAFNTRRRACKAKAEYLAISLEGQEMAMCFGCASHWNAVTSLTPDRIGAQNDGPPCTDVAELIHYATEAQAMRLDAIKATNIGWVRS